MHNGRGNGRCFNGIVGGPIHPPLPTNGRPRVCIDVGHPGHGPRGPRVYGPRHGQKKLGPQTRDPITQSLEVQAAFFFFVGIGSCFLAGAGSA
jgi:hypothetical protein